MRPKQNMIEKLKAMPILVEACPSFEGAWQAHLCDHGDDLQYIAAGNFADHLLYLVKNDDVSTFSDIGAALERLIVEGSPFVRGLAIAGVLEGIQNSWPCHKVDPERFFDISATKVAARGKS